MNFPTAVVSYCSDCTEMALVRSLLRHYGQPFQEQLTDVCALSHMTRGVGRIHVRLQGQELMTVEALMLHLLRRRGWSC